MIAQSTPDLSPLWEAAKGTMVTLSTLGIGWLVRTVRNIERGQQRMEIIVIGVDGKNGLRSKVQVLREEVDVITDRNLVIDAVKEAERLQYAGDDRRIAERRLRDIIAHEEEERRRS